MDDLRDFRCRLTAESALMLEAIRARRLRVIASLLWLTREPGSIEALVREYLREVGRT